jgi:uncharacterized membrane protein YagU involved in acid resistance
MNTSSMLLWGFAATVILTGSLSGCQAFGLTRVNLPYLLGTIFTPSRDRAKTIGFFVHFLNGWIFASVYCASFESWRLATWWAGSAIGAVHAAFVLLAGMAVLPSIHPRMANEEHGPTPTKQLEPPGFLALNFGRRTPVSVLVAHLVYGGIIGAFYRLS